MDPGRDSPAGSVADDHLCADYLDPTALAELERESYDVALIDLEMPVADGYYVAQIVRSWHGSQASRGCRLIAISAHSRDQAWPRCQGSGFDDFVEKPLDRQRLLRAVMHEALLAT